MPYRDEPWPAGTPNWVDLAVDDPAAAATFYETLFGWKVVDPAPDPADGGYLLAFKDDRAAAGIGPKAAPGAPAAWSTYLASDDADATAAAVTAAGGTLVIDPVDAGGQGRMFVASGPDGATFGVWEGRGRLGAEIHNEPGAYAWNELASSDLDTARRFYTEVFGYSYDDYSGPQGTYFIFKRPGDDWGCGGMADLAQHPAGTPSHWLAWFSVDSCDDTASRVAALGGAVVAEPYDTPFGRMAVVAGAQGEVFGLIDLAAGVGDLPEGTTVVS